MAVSAMQCCLAVYNAEKFAPYNLQPPCAWPELLAVARTFYEKEQTGRVLFTGAGGAPTTTQLYEWIVAAGGDPLYLSSQQYALAGDDFHYCGGLSAASWA
jgi:hypothetical protein